MYMLLNVILIHYLNLWSGLWYLQAIGTKQSVGLLAKFQKYLNHLGNMIQTAKCSLDNLKNTQPTTTTTTTKQNKNQPQTKKKQKKKIQNFSYCLAEKKSIGILHT